MKNFVHAIKNQGAFSEKIELLIADKNDHLSPGLLLPFSFNKKMVVGT
jgi:hypothetical protein